MRPLHLFLYAALSLLTACNDTQRLTPSDFDRMMSWLEGSWDNQAQVAQQIAEAVPEQDRHIRYAMRYTPIDAPAIKGQLYAIESYKAGDGLDGTIERVSLHRFFLPDDATEIVHEILFLKDKAFRKSLIGNLSPLTDLQEGDFTAREDCQLYWTWAGSRFEGATRPGACVTDSYTDEPITVEGFGALMENELSRHDRNFTMAGAQIKRPGYDSPEVFDRIE